MTRSKAYPRAACTALAVLWQLATSTNAQTGRSTVAHSTADVTTPVTAIITVTDTTLSSVYFLSTVAPATDDSAAYSTVTDDDITRTDPHNTRPLVNPMAQANPDDSSVAVSSSGLGSTRKGGVDECTRALGADGSAGAPGTIEQLSLVRSIGDHRSWWNLDSALYFFEVAPISDPICHSHHFNSSQLYIGSGKRAVGYGFITPRRRAWLQHLLNWTSGILGHCDAIIERYNKHNLWHHELGGYIFCCQTQVTHLSKHNDQFIVARRRCLRKRHNASRVLANGDIHHDDLSV